MSHPLTPSIATAPVVFPLPAAKLSPANGNWPPPDEPVGYPADDPHTGARLIVHTRGAFSGMTAMICFLAWAYDRYGLLLDDAEQRFLYQVQTEIAFLRGTGDGTEPHIHVLTASVNQLYERALSYVRSHMPDWRIWADDGDGDCWIWAHPRNESPPAAPAGAPTHDCLATGSLKYRGVYGAPGFGQSWACTGCGRDWARLGEDFYPSELGVHILTPEDCE